MSELSNIRPSTIEGIKSLAKKLKRANGISHSVALDQASKQAGFQTFRHAQKSLPTAKEKRQ